MNRTLQIFGKTLFPVLELYFGEQALSAFQETPESDLVLYHFTLGAWLRNAFLHPGNALFESFCAEGIRDPDEMSAAILLEFHRFIQPRSNLDKS